jgi:hypothetical protein
MRMNRRLFLKALGVGAGALTLSHVLGWGQQSPSEDRTDRPH